MSHAGKSELSKQGDIPAHVLLFDPGALLSNAALFSLTQELRGRSRLLWEGWPWLGDGDY